MAKHLVQRSAIGQFAPLACGSTHYVVEGEAGPWCVLVHGYATPLFIYDGIARGLVEAGYRVLRYDLLGRGLSQRVRGPYTPDLFATQLAQLVDLVLGAEQFYLFGTSMGGTVVTTYVAAHPDRVRKLVLYAPAGMVFDAPLYMRLVRLPVLGEMLYYTLGPAILTKGCAGELIYSGPDVAARYRADFARYVHIRGTMHAVLSSLRHTILAFDATRPGYEGTARSGVPVLVVWGTADKTMPYYQSKAMQGILPNMRLVTYPDSGHVFLYDEAQRTLDDTLPFLQQ